MEVFQEKYLNPFTDFGFKKLFGSEPNKDLLIDFLNQIQDAEYRVESLSYKKSDFLGATELDRKAIFDLYCENSKGEKFIIELQKAKQNYFKDRSVYYSSFPIQEQGQKGEWNYELQAVFTVGILDFCFDDEQKNEVKVVVEQGRNTKAAAQPKGKVKVVVKLMDTEEQTVFYDKLAYIYLQMPNFTKTEEELETQYDKWLYVLKNLPKLQDRPQKLQDKVFDKLFQVAEIAKFDPQERMAYHDSLKYYRDLKNVIDTAKGEGEEKGLTKGRAEGRAEGREQERVAIAQKAIKAGLTDDVIASLTGLDTQEIAQLRTQ